MIVTLGRFSLARFFPGESISRARGRVRLKDGRRIYPIMHPAAALYRQEMRNSIVEDFRRIPDLLAQARQEPLVSEPGRGKPGTAHRAAVPVLITELLGNINDLNHSLRVIPLGGLGEIGKNMMALECGDDIVVVDCGVQFPTEDLLGVDLIIPDVSYLVERADRVRGILITHGHEDPHRRSAPRSAPA